LQLVGMPQFSSEPKFEPELFRTRPKFGPRFGGCAELDHKFSSGFRQGSKSLNLAEPGSNQTFFDVYFIHLPIWRTKFCFVCHGRVYNSLDAQDQPSNCNQIVDFRPSERSEAWLTCLMVGARLCIAATTAVFNSVFGSRHY